MLFIEWEKTDIEGALFIYSRNAEPFHSIFINNRLNTNSLVEPITAQIDLQSQPPFLLYRNERSKIRGFWFYNSNECDRIADLIKRIVKDCQTKNTKTNVDPGDNQILSLMQQLKNTNNHTNILSMLSKAQDDYNKCSMDSAKPKDAQNVIHSGINNPSVMSFFAAIPQEVSTKQHLKTNGAPPLHTVDEIEKQHRASTPSNEGNGKLSPFNPGMKLHRPISPETELGTSPIVSFFNSVNMSGQKMKPFINAKNVSEIEHRISQKIDKEQVATKISMGNTKPALMPPTMFKASNISGNGELNAIRNKHIDPLTKEQLVHAFDHLLKNDADFIDKLHDAYLKSITANQ